MNVYRIVTVFLASLLCSGMAASAADDKPDGDGGEAVKEKSPDSYVVTQTYKNFTAEDGGTAKNLVQTVHVSPKKMKIADNKDTFLFDFNKKKMWHLEHIGNGGGRYDVETFKQIDDRVEKRRKSVLTKLKKMRAGPNKDDYAGMWSGLVEINRTYDIQLTEVDTKVGAYQATHKLKVTAFDQWNEKGTVVIDALMTDKYKISANNARVLFLMELVGEQLVEELKDTNMLPLKLFVVLPDGGEVKSEVTKIDAVEKHPESTWEIPRNYRKKGGDDKDSGKVIPLPPPDDDDEW